MGAGAGQGLLPEPLPCGSDIISRQHSVGFCFVSRCANHLFTDVVSPLMYLLMWSMFGLRSAFLFYSFMCLYLLPCDLFHLISPSLPLIFLIYYLVFRKSLYFCSNGYLYFNFVQNIGSLSFWLLSMWACEIIEKIYIHWVSRLSSPAQSS